MQTEIPISHVEKKLSFKSDVNTLVKNFLRAYAN